MRGHSRGHLRFRRAIGAVAAAGVMVAAPACSAVTAGRPVPDPGAKVSSRAPDGPAQLTVTTFGEYGFEDLFEEYQDLNPDITVNHEKITDAPTYYQLLESKLAAGTPPDVVLVDESYLPKYLGDPSQFHDLAEIGPAEITPEDWLDWTYQNGVAGDGTWVGYSTGAGPLAMAYRTDLFAQAGLPATPDEVATLFESWESYFAAGDRYVQATGKPWFDSGALLFNSMHSQLDLGYFDDSDNLVVGTNPGIRANWDQVTGAIGRGQSARLPMFFPEWHNGFQAGAFATIPAPYWMLPIIQQYAGPQNAGRWAVATVFPGGGANWGGSYLAVPRETANPEAAAGLAAWLSAPEQQIAMFGSANMFPSQVEALESPEIRDLTNPYFGETKLGQLYADLANRVPEPHHRGPNDAAVQQEAFGLALQTVENGVPGEQAFQQAVTTAEQVAQR